MSSTVVRFAYLRPDPKYSSEKPFIFESTTSYDVPTRTNTEKDEYDSKVEDVRGQESKFTYAEHGFRYLVHYSRIDQSNVDNHDTLGYANETMELLKNEFNAERVICYDVRRRSSEKAREQLKKVTENAYEQPRVPAPPVYAVHIDHTILGGFHRARRHFTDDEITKYLNSGDYRIRIVNTWRPIKEIQASPLAVCDYHTIDVSDLMETDLASETYVGETYSLTYNPGHCFYWMSRQKPHELCVFVTFDSDNSFPDTPLTTCAHTAFENPLAPVGAAPRESIEVRSLVLTKIR